MSKFFKQIKAQAAAQIEVRQRLLWYPNILTIQGFQVIHDNTLMLAMNIHVAGAAMMTNGKRIILVDDSFLTLSEQTQLFILHHEMGHHAHQHKEKRMVRVIQGLLGLVSRNEQQADAYAVFMVGKQAALSALGEIQQLMPTNMEIRSRINIIRKGF
jgi:Zn-dependent protease with chaperone function